MGRRAATTSSPHKQSRRVPMTPEAREDFMINLAMDNAERQLREGTASSQVITHFLKLGSSRERMEQDKLKEDIEYSRTKTEAITASAHAEERYAEAIEAMRKYSGADD
ncbi:MAG TPA: hypothetical protein DCW90_06890 [Lachnospiraceae bacterium]|nr:hypothetical protein [Lachnospiraceae bacterium]